MQYVRKIGLTALVVFGFLSTTTVWAAGTPQNTLVTNNVTLQFTVNGNAQNSSTSVDFRVDRKLVVDVTANDSDWVTVVPGQVVANPGTPALNFTVSNDSNDAVRLVLGLIDQDNTQVSGTFSPVGAGFTIDPTPGVVVAIDNGNGAFDQGTDTELVLNGSGYYDLPPTPVPVDGTIDIVVAIGVDAGETNGNFQTYSLVAALADTATGLPLQLDDSGNIAPASGATPNTAINGLTSIETVWADLVVGAANPEDEQFDFFNAGTTGLGTAQVSFDGQSTDSSGFTIGVALSLTKYVEVIWDPVTGNRYNADRSTVDGDPKAIPGAILMYVLGIENENAALTAAGVALTDTFPGQVTAGNAAAVAPVVIPDAATFTVGAAPDTVFDLTAVVDLDIVSFASCSAPTVNPGYTGPAPGTGLAGDVGDCSASDVAYIVYFVTLN